MADVRKPIVRVSDGVERRILEHLVSESADVSHGDGGRGRGEEDGRSRRGTKERGRSGPEDRTGRDAWPHSKPRFDEDDHDHSENAEDQQPRLLL